jgi:hypothetical protein
VDILTLSNATVANLQLTPPVLARQCKVVSAWLDNLVEWVKAVVSRTRKRQKNLEFKFELTREAANHNVEVLKTYSFNLGLTMKDQALLGIVWLNCEL